MSSRLDVQAVWKGNMVRNLNHNRPQLRLLDNLRRELGKSQVIGDDPTTDIDWPDYLRPVVSRKGAHIAFSELLEAISVWTEEAEILSFSNFPLRLQRAARSFAGARVQHPYDNQYRGRDWVADLMTSENDSAKAWGNVLAIFVGAENEQT